MIKKLFLTVLFFILVIYSLRAQITIQNIEKKIEEEVLKPPSYDSLKEIEYYDHYEADPNYISYDPNYPTTEDLFYKQYIGLKIFYPPCGNEQVNTCNRYFTIIDFLNRDSLIAFRNAMWHQEGSETPLVLNQKKFFEPYTYHDLENNDIGFILKDDITEDTLYLLGGLDDFILVPYFVKQKQMFDGKTFVAVTTSAKEPYVRDEFIIKDLITNKNITIVDGTKWKCEVTLLDYNKANGNDDEDSIPDYKIAYIFRNTIQTIALFSFRSIPYSGITKIGFGTDRYSYAFILADVLYKQEHLDRLKKEELLAKQKRDEEIRINNERITNKKNKKYCIDNFGKENGELIAQGKVKIGMTEEMCEVAWGKPFDKNKTTTSSGVIENWHYGSKKSLHFVDGVLTRIDE